MNRFALHSLLMFVVLAGCTGNQGAGPSVQLSHVRLLTGMHTRASTQLRRPPKDEQEFKEFIKSSNVSLETMGVNSVDEMFISERDGQPLGVAYGSPQGGSDVVVWETVGVDGKRLVGHSIGMVEEVDEAKFKELVPQQ
jgi:hypothetical protein